MTALVFDRDQVDEVDDWAESVGRLGRSAILWVDAERPDEREAERLAERLELDEESADRLARSHDRPYFRDHGEYLHATVYAPAHDGRSADLEQIDCLVSKRWILTVHDRPVEVLERFRERAGGSGDTGRLDGLEFLADLVEWVLGSYLAAFEDVEQALEEFDARAMAGGLDDPESELRRLVDLRRQIGRLRRALVSHRELLLALTRPELEAIASTAHAERFSDLRARLEDVVQSARDSRDSVVGSFDVLIARSEHRTNEIMKVLTLASILLLPGSLIAGLMGMNFKLGIFQQNAYFWVVLGLIAALAVATVTAARARRWI